MGRHGGGLLLAARVKEARGERLQEKAQPTVAMSVSHPVPCSQLSLSPYILCNLGTPGAEIDDSSALFWQNPCCSHNLNTQLHCFLFHSAYN